MRILIYTAVPVLYTVHLFLEFSVLDVAIALFACLSIGLSFSRARKLYVVMAILFISTGTALFFSSEAGWEQLLRSFHPMAGILGLFLVLPFIQSLVRIGKYDAGMKRLVRYQVHTLHGVYCRISLGVYLLSIFLAIAAIPIGAQSFGKVPLLSERARLRFLNSAIVRPFALALMWSPIEMIVVAGISATNADYSAILPILLGISLLFLGFDWLLQWRRYRVRLPEQDSLQETSPLPRTDLMKVVQLFGAIALLFLSVSAVNALFGKGMLISIILVLIPFSFIWSVLIRKARTLGRRMVRVWPGAVRNMADFNLLFLSAGFFLTAVQASPLSGILNELVLKQFHQLHLFVFCMFISLVMAMLSHLGLHAVIILFLMSNTLLPIFTGHEIGLAVLLIGTLIALAITNPFTVTAALLMNYFGLYPFTMARWNLGYAASLVLFIDAIAYRLLSG